MKTLFAVALAGVIAASAAPLGAAHAADGTGAGKNGTTTNSGPARPDETKSGGGAEASGMTKPAPTEGSANGSGAARPDASSSSASGAPTASPSNKPAPTDTKN